MRPAAGPALFFGGVAVFAASAALPRLARESAIVAGVLGAAVVLAVWGAILVAKRGAGALRVTPWLRANHYLQAVVQIGLFAYWVIFWPRVADQFLLIAVQLLFAFLLDMLIGWTRWGEWRAGFGVVPPTLSVNLFLWFEDALFPLQLLMIAVAFLAKGYVTWERGGERRHIFNPSGLTLTIFSLGLIFTGTWQHTHGELISIALGAPPYMYVALAALSLIVLATHPVVLITLASAVTVWGLGAIYYAVTGAWLFVDTTIPIAVFLGMLLLVTDPATTPRSDAGKLITGVLYGASVVGFYIGFRGAGLPAFFDKLLLIPVLNLMVPWLDRVAERGRLDRLWAHVAVRKRMLAHVGAWVAAFCLLAPGLEAHPGRDPEVWRVACRERAPFACKNLALLYDSLCLRGSGEACFNLGLMRDEGDEVPRDPAQAAGALAHGCELEFAPACNRLGSMLAVGNGAPPDEARAAALFAHACEAGDAPACANFATALREGAGVAPDPVRAAQLEDQACRADVLTACRRVADRVLRGGGRDRPAAADALERLCGADDLPACANLGLMLIRGDGIAADPTRAVVLYQRACKGGLDVACTRLKTLDADPAPRPAPAP